MAFLHCSGTIITGFAPNALIKNLAKTQDDIIPSVSASFQGCSTNPVKINTFSPFFMFAISPFAAWVEIGSPVNLRAPAYKILQTPYPLGSRFIRESKLQPTLYSVNSDFVSVCIINSFRWHRPFRKTAVSAVSLSSHVFNAFRAACCGRTDCSFL